MQLQIQARISRILEQESVWFMACINLFHFVVSFSLMMPYHPENTNILFYSLPVFMCYKCQQKWSQGFDVCFVKDGPFT